MASVTIQLDTTQWYVGQLAARWSPGLRGVRGHLGLVEPEDLAAVGLAEPVLHLHRPAAKCEVAVEVKGDVVGQIGELCPLQDKPGEGVKGRVVCFVAFLVARGPDVMDADFDFQGDEVREVREGVDQGFGGELELWAVGMLPINPSRTMEVAAGRQIDLLC